MQTFYYFGVMGLAIGSYCEAGEYSTLHLYHFAIFTRPYYLLLDVGYNGIHATALVTWHGFYRADYFAILGCS